MGVGSVQVVWFLLTAISHRITVQSLMCYKCSNLVIKSDISSPEYEFIRSFETTLRNAQCFRRTPDYVEPETQQDMNTGQIVNRNKMYPQTCPNAVLGSSQVVRCGIWEGTVYATFFDDKYVAMNAFSFGCITLVDATELLNDKCYDRNNEAADKKQFELELQRYFKGNVKVTNFVGTLCIAPTAEKQLTSSSGRATAMGVWSLMTVVVLGIFL